MGQCNADHHFEIRKECSSRTGWPRDSGNCLPSSGHIGGVIVGGGDHCECPVLCRGLD